MIESGQVIDLLMERKGVAADLFIQLSKRADSAPIEGQEREVRSIERIA